MMAGVLSMFTATVAVAVLPAWSTAVPATTWLAPSAFTMMGGGQLAMPNPASTQLKLTVTLVLFQPFTFGGGLMAVVIVGGVRSVASARRNLDGQPGSGLASELD